jgi:hypothetical protein
MYVDSTHVTTKAEYYWRYCIGKPNCDRIYLDLICLNETKTNNKVIQETLCSTLAVVQRFPDFVSKFTLLKALITVPLNSWQNNCKRINTKQHDLIETFK